MKALIEALTCGISLTLVGVGFLFLGLWAVKVWRKSEPASLADVDQYTEYVDRG